MKKHFLLISLIISSLLCFNAQAGRFVCWTFGTVRDVTDFTIDTTADIVDTVVPF